MHDMACEFVHAVVRSKDAQKQLARTSLNVLVLTLSLPWGLLSMSTIVWH